MLVATRGVNLMGISNSMKYSQENKLELENRTHDFVQKETSQIAENLEQDGLVRVRLN